MEYCVVKCGKLTLWYKMFQDSWTHQADGRLRPMENLYLLNGENRLYIPVTQQPAPMTEDLLEEHAEVLAKYVYIAPFASSHDWKHAC